MPLGHLIALISNAHLRKPKAHPHPSGASLRPAPSRLVNTAYRKTSLHRDRPKRELAVSELGSHGIDMTPHGASTLLRNPMPKDDADSCPASRAYPFFTMSRNPPLE